MSFILKDIKNNLKTFVLLFIAFTVTLFSFFILFSTIKFYKYKDSAYNSGNFKYTYLLEMNKLANINLNDIDIFCKKNFISSSVITDIFQVRSEANKDFELIAMLNENLWELPIVSGEIISKSNSHEIMLGTNVRSTLNNINLSSENYKIKGVIGYSFQSHYDNRILMYFNDLPNVLKEEIKVHGLRLFIRSNIDPEKEIKLFIADLNSKNINLKYAKVDAANSNRYIKALVQLPLNMVLIALINIVCLTYLWSYRKKAGIAIRKALGASNFDIVLFYYLQFLICATAAVVPSILIINILNKFPAFLGNFKLLVEPLNFVISIVISLGTAMIICIITIANVVRDQPARSIKE